jgi:hypothetical protein
MGLPRRQGQRHVNSHGVTTASALSQGRVPPYITYRARQSVLKDMQTLKLFETLALRLMTAWPR